MKIEINCPAKVNLFLAVGKKDAIGYHPIRTIFQAVGLYDVLTLESRESASDPAGGIVHEVGAHRIASDWPEFPAESTVSKALRLASEFVILPPLQVTIQKQIPAESGLGGGSSDAAGVLLAIRQMGINILPHEVKEVAKAVGADVPFFLLGGRAKAEGYGEILTPLPDLPSEWYVIVRPEVGCATGQMYAALDAFEYLWRDFPNEDELYNDFERVAPCESLELIETLKSLGARDAGLSGSGSAVFGRFLAEDLAVAAKDYLVERLSCRAWSAKTLDASAIPERMSV